MHLCHLRRLGLLAPRRESALAERFLQMLEEKLSQPQQKSLVDENPELKKLYDKYATELQKDDQFKRLHAAQMALLERENLLNGNRHAKGIADTVSKPAWAGSESAADASNRMLLDLLPPAKPVNGHSRLFTPPKDPRARMAAAREGSLDYKTGITESQNSKPDDNFRELYRERLMGPSMFVNSNSPTATMGLAQTMADVRINATINRQTGKFDSPDMGSVRGKPLDPKHLANATDSNYFVNQILNKQEVLPPWIENQQSLDKEIKRFRGDLESIWTKRAMAELDPGSSSMESLRSGAHRLSLLPFDDAFAATHMAYVSEKVRLLNSQIRSYNLMCPSSSLHKFKLVGDQEMRNLFRRAMDNLPQAVDAWYAKAARAREVRERMNLRSMFLLFDTAPAASASPPQEAPSDPKPVHFWKSIKEMLR